MAKLNLLCSLWSLCLQFSSSLMRGDQISLYTWKDERASQTVVQSNLSCNLYVVVNWAERKVISSPLSITGQADSKLVNCNTSWATCESKLHLNIVILSKIDIKQNIKSCSVFCFTTCLMFEIQWKELSQFVNRCSVYCETIVPVSSYKKERLKY